MTFFDLYVLKDLRTQQVVLNLFVSKSVCFNKNNNCQQLNQAILYQKRLELFCYLPNLPASKYVIFNYIVFSRNLEKAYLPKTIYLKFQKPYRRLY
jgi:hypothetical protein